MKKRIGLIAILLSTITVSNTVAASEFQSARCETNNFGVIGEFIKIEPTPMGLDVVLKYDDFATPVIFPEVLQHLADTNNINVTEIESVELHFNRDQCEQLETKNWVIQCISDRHPLPRDTKVRTTVTLINQMVLTMELETRISIESKQITNAMFGTSERPIFKMSTYRSRDGQPGSIVTANSHQENIFGYCRN
ncbi:MAG: hypothetical protein CL677_09745 [Bdellovibrionaceae bacterium]|nr:hypothetical protein [Pseudobdellovibrionaceae bacterium]|tara:strand:- start:1027 stop:1608 length:582 start_codon:yes stop_codon:yes gene_type:complete